MVNKFISPKQNFYSDGELTVVDPITLNNYKASVLSLPSASIPGYELPAVYADQLTNTLVECNFLNKILFTPSYNYSVRVSDNAINWTGSYRWLPNSNQDVVGSSIASSDELKMICVLNKYEYISEYDKYIAGILYSYDAYNWFTGSMDNSFQALSICYSPSLQRFVAVGSNTRAWYSDNGINWYLTTSSITINNSRPMFNESTYTTDSTNCTWRDVTWDSVHEKFIAVGNRNIEAYYTSSVMTSSDGITWSINASAMITPSFPKVVTSGNGVTIFFTGNKLWTSVDGGTTWVSQSRTEESFKDIAYSSTLNKFYIPYSIYYLPQEFVHFLTSSNGTDWGNYSCSLNINEVINEYQLLPQQHQSGYSTPSNLIWSTNLQKFIGITNNNSQRSVLYSDSEGLNFIGSNESDVANVQFKQSPPSNLISNILSGYTGSMPTLGFTTDNNAYAWIEFDLNLDGGDPYGAGSGTYLGEPPAGIIIDSASLKEFPAAYLGGAEDIVVDGIRYLRELDTDGYHYAYYEKSEPLAITSASTSTFSGSFKTAGRDYVSMWYGIDGDQTSDEVGMILNLKDGIVEYYEDATNSDSPVSYGMTNSWRPLVFLQSPILTYVTNSYWELTFKVGYDRYNSQYDQLIHTGSIIFTETGSSLPYVFSTPIPTEKTLIPQSESIDPITAPIPHHWWRADYGLTTSGWLASSGSINFTFSGSTVANSTVGAYFSQSFGSSSILSSDINAKHIFIRADNILAQGAVMGSTINDFHQLMFCLSSGINNWVISLYTASVDGGKYQTSGLQTGSKLTYIDFGVYNRATLPRPALYKDNWSVVFEPNISYPSQTGTYTNQFTWPSGSRMLIGRRQFNNLNSYANLYIKEIAIFTSSISIGEAHKLSQEMLARWP